MTMLSTTRRTSTNAALLFGALAWVLVATPSAFAQTVKTDFDKKTDFAKYKSFAFRKGTDAPTPFAQQRIEGAVATQLKTRGMTPAESADLLAYTHTQISSEKRMDVSSFGYGGYAGWGGWGGAYGTSSVTVSNIPVGTVVVDLVDGASNALVWRGIASDTLLTNPTPEKSEKRINKAMEKLFRGFPVPPVESKK
ncbi:MAG TPA: DUF4136 domain-containing protein [Patescibacteria group bacterium]|nr:DUF4136 domain-containing protein [Patescibacteria group bacterium]